MPEINPYAPPRSDLGMDMEDLVTGEDLATRGSRFVAAMIDGMCNLVIAIPLLWAFGFYDGFPGRTLSPLDMFFPTVVGFAAWIAIHIYYLRVGQTIGKRAMSIRMVDADTGQVPSLGRLVGLRALPVTAITLIPVVGSFLPLIDVLFIFGQERRCIHDLIARTKVVVVGAACKKDRRAILP